MMPSAPATTASRLTAARVRLKLTQREASARVAIQQPLWAAYESGAKVPSLQQIRRIAEALGVDPHTLDPSLMTVRKPRRKIPK